MADAAGRSAGASRRAGEERWFTRSRLYLLLGLVVTVLGIVWATQRAVDGVRANLDDRLRDAGAGADAALVALEAEQLSALRAITFTDGVPAAVAARHAATLNRLVAPIQANAHVPMVDLVLPDGRVLFAVRSEGAPRPVASRAGLPALRQALRQARGERGGRFSVVVVFRSGPVLLTIGPVALDGRPVGAVLVMTPLADVLGRLSQQVAADLTAYDAEGRALATTATADPEPVARDVAAALVGGGALVMRDLDGGRREALGRLIVDHRAAAVLGVALPDNSWETGRAVALYAALCLLGAVAVLAASWARDVRGRRRES